MRIAQIISVIRYWGTRIYMRAGFGRLEEFSEYSYEDLSRDVYWFDSDSRTAGHCTPFNTILMNKNPFRNLSEDARDYVYIHEYGHASISPPITALMYAFLIPTMIFAIISPIAASLQVIITWLGTNSLELTAISLISGITVVLLFTGLFSVFSWLSEGHAELFVLNRLGEDEYLKANNEIKEYADRGLIRRLIHRIRYPPPRFVIWISEKIQD